MAANVVTRVVSLLPPLVLGIVIARCSSADYDLPLASRDLVFGLMDVPVRMNDGLYATLWRVQAGEVESLPDVFLAAARERAAERPGPGPSPDADEE